MRGYALNIESDGKGSNRVATRVVISMRNLFIERLLGLLHSVMGAISGA